MLKTVLETLSKQKLGRLQNVLVHQRTAWATYKRWAGGQNNQLVSIVGLKNTVNASYVKLTWHKSYLIIV